MKVGKWKWNSLKTNLFARMMPTADVKLKAMAATLPDRSDFAFAETFEGIFRRQRPNTVQVVYALLFAHEVLAIQKLLEADRFPACLFYILWTGQASGRRRL
mmetsp:Transcript_6253/g.24371  ORF Transcript_6253/g.24371 Transcript_6253/m.24371 type:complete len:102 (+) Transcript_6253:901-1206(+)